MNKKDSQTLDLSPNVSTKSISSLRPGVTSTSRFSPKRSAGIVSNACTAEYMKQESVKKRQNVKKKICCSRDETKRDKLTVTQSGIILFFNIMVVEVAEIRRKNIREGYDITLCERIESVVERCGFEREAREVVLGCFKKLSTSGVVGRKKKSLGTLHAWNKRERTSVEHVGEKDRLVTRLCHSQFAQSDTI